MRRLGHLLLPALTLLFVAAGIQAQNIQTVAGGGPANNIPAADANIQYPSSVAADGAGGFYVASPNASRVYKVDASGEFTIVAGDGTPGFSGDGGPAASAELNGPYGVAVDSHGNLYIADTGNGRIRKVDISGMITTVAGNGSIYGPLGDGGPATSAGLSSPRGVAVDTSGNLYITDTYNFRIRKVDSSGIITTVAGGSYCSSGTCGDGGPATSAGLGRMYGNVGVDGSGNIYIPDYDNARVRKVDTSGTITTVAGNGTRCSGPCGDGGPATSASLYAPFSIAVDSAGDFYISDPPNERIRKVDTSGVIKTVAGGGSGYGFNGDGGLATNATLNEPEGAAVDSAGNLYIADTWNQRIRKVDASTLDIATVAGNGTAGFSGDGGQAISASLYDPQGVAVDSTGNFYISDQYNQRIRKVGTDGTITTIAGKGISNLNLYGGFSGDGGPATDAQISRPSGLALDAAGNLYIADTANNRIRKVDYSTGNISTVAGNGAYYYNGDNISATSASLDLPLGVAVDSAGNIYIADTRDQRIRKVDTSGIITTVAGNGTVGYSGDNGLATNAQLHNPAGVAVDDTGNIYIADTWNNRIRKVDHSTGYISTVVGSGAVSSNFPFCSGAGFSGDGGPATSAELNCPQGVAVDSGGNIYIADTWNQRIREVDTSTGNISTVAGNGGYGFRGDGGLATSATLASPFGVAVDGGGDIFIADTYNQRIRKVSLANTPVGSNVSVSPTDTATSTSPVSLTFSSITQAGNTTLTTSSSGPAVPQDFKLGTPATYYNLATTATYSGSIAICIDYSGVSFQNTSQLSIWHYDTTALAWTQLTTTVDTTTTTACAVSPSLSPFALLEPAYAAQVQSPISADGTSVFSANRGVVPVKFTLTYGGASTCQLPPATISLIRIGGSSLGSVDQSDYEMTADSGSNFRIDTSSCQYVYNLDSSSLGSGTYQVNISIDNSVVGSGTFGLQ